MKYTYIIIQYKETLKKFLPNCTQEEIDKLVELKIRFYEIMNEKDFT